MKIRKPDEAEIRTEHRNLYKGYKEKDVAAAAGRSSTLLCRQLSVDEAIVRNPVSDVIMEMIGSVESEQPSIGKGVYLMIEEYAFALGFIDDRPVDIFDRAMRRLRSIDTKTIQNITEDEAVIILARAAELEKVIEGFTTKIVDAKNGTTDKETRERTVDNLG